MINKDWKEMTAIEKLLVALEPEEDEVDSMSPEEVDITLRLMGIDPQKFNKVMNKTINNFKANIRA